MSTRVPYPFDALTESFLIRAAHLGDRRARDAVVEAGVVWVHLHAWRLGHRGPEHEEAVAAGVEGLMRAVERFDPDRGTRLVTFAWAWIARAMQPGPSVPVTVALTDPPAVEEAPDLVPDLWAHVDGPWRDVLWWRFGFAPEAPEGLSRSAVAARLGLTEWQVRDREAKAIAHLRQVLGRVSDRAPLREPIPRSSIGRAFDC